jgi:hypothetical protein
MSESLDVRGNERHIRFVDQAGTGDRVLLRLDEPVVRYAVLVESASEGDALTVVLLGEADSAATFAELAGAVRPGDAQPPVYVKTRGVELLWRTGRAALVCDPDQVDALLPALAEFAHFEGELRRIEAEIAAAWGSASEDKALAFEVTTADLRRGEEVGARMAATLDRRIRLTRMEAHLYAPDVRLGPAGQRLGEALREKVRMEARAEIVDGQLEVFEHIYEMGAQRMGEYRASRQGNIVEWIIVVLLAAEALLMLVQVWRR